MDVDGRVEYKHRSICLQRQHDQTSPTRQFPQPILHFQWNCRNGKCTWVGDGTNARDFPTLDVGPQATSHPGNQAAVTMVIRDPQGATVRFENLTISTSFGNYNISVKTPFSFDAATAQYNATINLPMDLTLGNYNLTIEIGSWQYLDTQVQEWIGLQQTRLNETLVVTNNPAPPPNPPNNPGPSPPSSGQGSSTSTNTTTRSPISLL